MALNRIGLRVRVFFFVVFVLVCVQVVLFSCFSVLMRKAKLKTQKQATVRVIAPFADSDKFDVVIPWLNITEGGYFLPRNESDPCLNKRPYDGVGRNRIPYSEIIFGLRSFEKHGLMPFVRRVFVLYDSDRHRAPQFLREGQTSIRLLTHSEVLNGTKFADRLRGVHVVMAHLHRVTALSERFLVVHDDMMLVRPFDWSMHFSKDNKPLHQVHTKFITKEEKRYFPGHSDKRVMWGDEHVPIFVRKLVLAQMEETMEYSCSSNNTQEVCEFPHFAFYSFYQTFALFNGFGEVKRRGEQLGTEVHVIKCFLQRSLIAAVVAKRPQWLNLQGLGVSDEYTKCDANRIVVDKWFWSTFPKAADWENPEWEKW